MQNKMLRKECIDYKADWKKVKKKIYRRFNQLNVLLLI